MRSKKNTARKACIVILFFIGIMAIYYIARQIETNYFSNEIKNISEKCNEEIQTDKMKYNQSWYEKRRDVDTLLILGIDQSEHTAPEKLSESQQADFLLLLIVDHESAAVSGITINRDTMTDIQTFGTYDDYLGTEKTQIALSHVYGSNDRERCKNVRWAVENLFYGITVNNYISFTMDAVPILNDLVGGVTVKVKDDFSSVDSSLKMGEEIVLNKDQALLYVRSRENMKDATNLNRMERQREYVKSFMESARSYSNTDSAFYKKALDAVADYIVMDCSTGQMLKFDEALRQYEYKGISSLAGESRKGSDYMEYYVDENLLKEKVIDLFYKQCD